MNCEFENLVKGQYAGATITDDGANKYVQFTSGGNKVATLPNTFEDEEVWQGAWNKHLADGGSDTITRDFDPGKRPGDEYKLPVTFTHETVPVLYNIASRPSAASQGSIGSAPGIASVAAGATKPSTGSIGAIASAASIVAAASAASFGSMGNHASTGTVGSVASTASVATSASVGSVGSSGTVGSIASKASVASSASYAGQCHAPERHGVHEVALQGLIEKYSVDFNQDVVDDDSFATASSDTVPTSESVKEYVDSRVSQSPDNYITGLITSNGTDADHDIDIAIGQAMDTTNTLLMDSTSAFTKQIDVNWAEGSADGGFPSGLTLSADTTYHVFMIAKTDGTVDFGFDTSLTATNLLSDATGYTLYRRIASVLTDSSSNIIDYIQVGEWFYWDDESAAADYAATPGHNVITTVNLRIPSGIKFKTDIGVIGSGANSSGKAWDPDTTDRTDATTPAVLDFSGSVAGVNTTLNTICNTSGQIKFINAGGATALKFHCRGWKDLRGK